MISQGKLLYYGAAVAIALSAPLLFAKASEETAETPTTPSSESPSTTGKVAGPDAADAHGVAPAAALTPEERQARAQTVTVESESFRAELTTLNTGLTKFELKGDRYLIDGQPMNLVTTDKERYLPLSMSVEGVAIPDDALWTVVSRSAKTVVFQWQGDGVRIRRKYEAGDGPYQLWATTTIDNLGDRSRDITLTGHAFHYVAKASEESPIPLLPVRAPDRSSGLCMLADDDEREDGESLADEGKPLRFDGARFAAAENVYFLQAIAASPGPAQRCSMTASHRGRDADGDPLGTLFEVSLTHPTVQIAPGEQSMVRSLAYLGPKTPRELERAGHGLINAIDTGFFSLLAKLLTSMLRWLYELIGNWGVAIIVLTFIVKTLLYPLTAKQMQSMARMKELKPEMDRINELYADDRERKSAAMMELYRKKKINPAAGCFPMLIQLPIWFSLYTSLSTNVELFRAPFALWWGDLSAPDPYFVLPLALGLLMFVQQKISPATAADPMQQKMMLYLMPTMITSFMLFLPAGLCLYMFTNSALSIGQQRLIEAQLKTATAHTTSTPDKPETPGADAPAGQSEAASQADPNPTQLAKRPTTSRPSKAERRARRGK